MRLARRIAITFCAIALAVQANAQSTSLDQLVGRDLWADRLPADVNARLWQIIGSVPKGFLWVPSPWHVWKTNRNGAIRFTVFLGEQETMVPGGSSACVVLFDGGLNRINSQCFQTGWRITFDSALFEPSSDLAADMIVLKMVRFVNGRNVAREYFAVIDDRIRFIRMEDDKGEAVQNEYVYPNFEIGVVPGGETDEEWISMLRSSKKADVLSALVFLGGRHLTEPERGFSNQPRESKYASLFQRLMSNTTIRELISALTDSEDAWVRQAAQLAARGPRERRFE